MLQYQYQQREDIQSLIFPVVEENSYRRGVVGTVAYAGYLLARVGNKIARPLAREVKMKLASALYRLHSCNISHGGSRIDNALILNDEIKWIDFRESDAVTTQQSRQYDVESLYMSMGGSVANVASEIREYSYQPTEERLLAIFTKEYV